MTSYVVLAVAILIAIILDFWVVRTWEHYKRLRNQYEQEEKAYKKTDLFAAARDETIKDLQLDKVGRLYRQKVAPRLNFKTILELVILFIWAVVVSKPYLNMEMDVIPAGNEYNSAIQTHHLWTRAQECGWCAVWNGSVRGGYPAFVDIHGSALHPLVMATTLLWGVVNGAKITLFVSFWLAGMAQWWLARELNVSALARVFTAGIAISGGHITSRMELGAFGVVLSTAMVSLVFAAVLYVLRKRNNQSMVILGIVLASAILSGQGYMQVGLALMLPAFLVLIWQDRLNFRLWKKFGQAIGVALLLAAPFLVPLAHFSSQIVKDSDPKFSFAQPIVYMPLNLVIQDPSYYRSDTFDKLPFPHLTANFIGWIPVALAVTGAIRTNSENRRKVIFMLTGIVLIYLTASAILLKWIELIYPSIGGVRHPTQISGLAIPLLLGLAAYGIDAIHKLILPVQKETNTSKYRLWLFWVLMLPLLATGLFKTYEFSLHWVYTVRVQPRINELLHALKTPSLTWVNPPFGEHLFIQPAIEAGLKISPGIMTWKWRDREIPVASLEANRAGPPSEDSVKVNFVDGIPIYERKDNPYAAIYAGEAVYPCFASGVGGQIRVECDAPQSGQLIVKENMWAGWQARQDGQRIALFDSQYLQVNAHAGRQIYQFNYQPWDVPVGIILFFLGILICARMWRLPPTNTCKPVKKFTNNSTDKDSIMKSQNKQSVKDVFAELSLKTKKTFSFLVNWPTTTKKNVITMLIIELGVIALWAAIVGRPYLNFDPTIIPAGREFSNNIQFHHTWTRALECGWCAFWNHSVAGGYPAFTDLYGSTLHPVIVITTMLFGVLSATKIALVITFFTAGVAQWWLAYELKLGRTARLWSACIAVAAGHITGKMELGAFGMAFSIAMVSLIFASILAIYNGKGKKYIVLLGILGASAILSGQGYIQAGFLGTAPAFFILIFDHRFKIKNVWKEYFFAVIIACLLAAPLIVPYLNFSANFQKNSDFEFSATQPLQYLPLNLVINDWPYYLSQGILGKQPFPAMDNIYIGWIPVMLAIIGISKIKPRDRTFSLYAASTIVLVFLFASGTSLRWLAQVFQEIANIRFANHAAGLSVPLILGFSAYGLNYLLSLEWPTVQFSKKRDVTLSTKLLLIIPLLISINSTYQFSKYSISTYALGEDVFELLDSLKTNDSQWVSPPHGEQYFMEAAIASGLKISPGIMPWIWRHRETPKPFIEASREGSWDDYLFFKDVNGISLHKKPDEWYAKIITDDESIIPCFAKGTGGIIQVNCETETSGILIVKENYFPGWQVQINEEQANILRKEYWLAVRAPEGKNVYVFKYLPWDVPLGITLSLSGLFLCAWLWWKPEMPVRPTRENQEQQR